MTRKSTVQQGDEFEEKVADLLAYFPGARVERHVKIAGKDVDIVLVLSNALTGDAIIAIDAKDYARALTRDRVERELVTYHSVLQDARVSGLFLVTQKGIVANAKESLSSQTKSCRHFTFSELEDIILQPVSLLRSSRMVFEADHLNSYYVPPSCGEIDLKEQDKNFSLIFHPFMTYAAARHIGSFSEAVKLWKATPRGRKMSVPMKIDEKAYQRYRRILGETLGQTQDLESVVDQWVEDKTIRRGLALLGTYGTGKSSFAKRIAFKYAQIYGSQPGSRLPLLIELREFGSHQDIKGLITHTLVNKYGVSNGSFALFDKMNRSGKYLIILDGFDEMKQGMSGDALRYNFSELNSLMVDQAKVLLCGRPTIFESDEERSGLLAGDVDFVGGGARATYIPLKIASLKNNEILRLARDYATHVLFDRFAETEPKIVQLEEELERSKDLSDLLSRPVHIPMLLTILPDFQGGIGSLNRGILYDEFIKQIIRREIIRLPAAYRGRYSEAVRVEFACLLSREIARRGEARSIRTSEIPVQIISPYVRPGETIEMARRDLVQACFMDRKPPDLLVFGHKSFLEFLWAKLIVDRIRSGSDSAGVFDVAHGLSHEVLSFVLDLLEIDDFSSIETKPIFAQRIMLESLRTSAKYMSFTEPLFRSRRNKSSFPKGARSEARKNVLPIHISFDERSRLFKSIFLDEGYFTALLHKVHDDVAIASLVAACCIYALDEESSGVIPSSVLTGALGRVTDRQAVMLRMLLSIRDGTEKLDRKKFFVELHELAVKVWAGAQFDLLFSPVKDDSEPPSAALPAGA